MIILGLLSPKEPIGLLSPWNLINGPHFIGRTLFPKRYRFISFFINIFKAIAESAITGAIISCMHNNSQTGYLCQFS